MRTLPFLFSLTLFFIPVIYPKNTMALITDSKIQPISAKLKERINYLKKRNPTSFSRPSSCPLQISKHLSILTKLESIKILFKNTCFSDFEEQFSAILDGARDLEMSLKETASTISDTTIPSLKELENGEKVAKIFNGLSDIYSKNKCSIHNDRILVTIADIITDVSRFGALAPGRVGGLLFSGGAGASATLLLVNELLRKGFKFQDKNYRRSFIKLNCAFYDVRNEMESKGLFTIKTKEHETQLAVAKEVEKELTNLKKKNNDYIKSVFKQIENRKEIFKKDSFPLEADLLANLILAEKILTKEIVDLPNNPHEMQKLKLIFDLSNISEKIEIGLKKLRIKENLPLNSMDKMFVEDLSQFNESKNPEAYQSLLKLGLKELKKTIGGRLNFNNSRIKNSLQKIIGQEIQEWEKENNIEKLKKDLNRSLKKQNEIIKTHLENLKTIKEKLKNILSIKDFTSRDDGRGAIVDILDEFNTILTKIYGRVGHSFMSFTLNTGYKHLKNFDKKFSRFSSRYLKNGSLKDPRGLAHSERVAACQDARPFRRIFHFGHGLIEQGYDFIETNADLFHSDNFSLYLRRPEHRRNLVFMTKWSKLRRHYQSGYYANRVIHNLSVRHLSDKVLSHRSLGKLMLKSHSSKKKAEILQNLIEEYDCLNITNDL